MTPEEKQRQYDIWNAALTEHNLQIERLTQFPERMRDEGTPLDDDGLEQNRLLIARYVDHRGAVLNWIEYIVKS